MNQQFVQIIETALPGVSARDLSLPFDEMGLDSFDLLNIRAGLERQLEEEISDLVWIDFGSLQDVYSHWLELQKGAGGPAAQDSDVSGYSRDFELNMPHMAMGGMSESWLFKELGAIHWELLCRGLGQRSSELADEMGNRLYATFARVRIEGSVSLGDFCESEPLNLSGNISRYGGGMYYGEFGLVSLASPEKQIRARLITSFSRRGDTGNTSLVKSQPVVGSNLIDNLSSPPEFVEEYRIGKKGQAQSWELGGESFQFSDDVIAEETYDLNPYYDANGVGLLYFAAYPIVTEICEAKYFNSRQSSGAGRWEMQWRTISRDVLYYANCDLDDSIIYKLHQVEQDDGRLKTAASLFRRSDGTLMARIFTVKVRPPGDAGPTAA
jgi:probable biosynthetic protein (TIGR04098 family)